MGRYSTTRRLWEHFKNGASSVAAVFSNNPKHQKDERDEISALMTDFTTSAPRPIQEDQPVPDAAQRLNSVAPVCSELQE